MSDKQTGEVAETGKFGATCHKSDGTICDAHPVKGSTICRRHLANPKARANAAVRAEVMAWRLDDATADPGQTLLRLLTQAAHRAGLYGLLLEQQYDAAEAGDAAAELPAGVRALIGHRYTVSDGTRWPVAEAIRGLVDLEGQERDRAARYAKLALDAGIAERLVRLEEDKAAALVAMLRGLLSDLAAIFPGLDPRDPRVSVIVTSRLRALEAGSAA